MRALISTFFCFAALGLTGCSNEPGSETKSAQVRVVPAGEKAVVGHLTYSIVDSQILTRLGDDPNPRVPHDRFILVQIAVSSSNNTDSPIPSIELVSDSGQTYTELADGTGVPSWLGMVRHVGPNQTERGTVAFDAPPTHYKLRLSDESLSTEVLADLPLSFTHVKIDDSSIPTTEIPDVKPDAVPGKKK
jgi:hypothetical protein